MYFKVTFETGGSFFDAWLPRDDAIAWLIDRGVVGLALGSPRGGLLPWASCSDEQIAHGLSMQTAIYVGELVVKGSNITIRHESDDEPPVVVAVRPAAITAVIARPRDAKPEFAGANFSEPDEGDDEGPEVETETRVGPFGLPESHTDLEH